MKKAKINNKIFSVLCAVLSAVFAISMGVTYCVSSLLMEYGTNPNSTALYLGNQQYHLINDTITNPVTFGEGGHNFEIALQYAIDYDFDVRLKYSLAWSNGKSTDNVILNFANRDNIIYDNQYIFLANATAKGNGKITFITGVDYVDVNDSNYHGASLTITISEVKINKAQGYSDEDNNILYSSATTSLAARAWLENKQRDGNYAMVYNYRRDFNHGVKYPELNTAYKKNVSDNNVSSATWTGGNESYAGLGVYIITNTSVKLQVEVAGIWRSLEDNGTGEEKNATKPIHEDNVKFNYAKDWTRIGWDENTKLWETRTFDFYIPAKTSCYIDILESIEITSGGYSGTLIGDTYRLVTNVVTLNGQAFRYSETTNDEIQFSALANSSTHDAISPYEQTEFEIINASAYTPGLYNSQASGSAEQTFNTNISVINNTNSCRKITVTATLYYHISNGNISLYYDSDPDKKRIEEYPIGSFANDFARFGSGLFFSYSLATSITFTKTIMIDAMTSVNVFNSYKVPAELQSSIINKFTQHYDVWTYLDVSVADTGEEQTENLQIETRQTDSNVNLFVKNNTNKIVNGVSVSGLVIQELDNVSYVQVTGENAPADWKASFWKYYSKNGETYTQLTAAPVYQQNEFYLKTQGYSTFNWTSSNLNSSSSNPFTSNANNVITSEVTLMPGEMVLFATVTTSKTKKILVSGTATANSVSAPTSLMLVNSGNSNAYLHNTTANSYYVRFSGTYTGSNENIKQYSTDTTYNYFIGIIRPGQIVEIPMSSIGNVDLIIANEAYAESDLTGWTSGAKADMTSLLT